MCELGIGLVIVDVSGDIVLGDLLLEEKGWKVGVVLFDVVKELSFVIEFVNCGIVIFGDVW